jgi:hypothetical protein
MIAIFGVSELPAGRSHVAEALISVGSVFNPGDKGVKVVLQKMLEQARRNGCAQILVWRRPPTNDERPYSLRLVFDEFTHSDDRLPAGIDVSFRCRLARKK